MSLASAKGLVALGDAVDARDARRAARDRGVGAAAQRRRREHPGAAREEPAARALRSGLSRLCSYRTRTRSCRARGLPPGVRLTSDRPRSRGPRGAVRGSDRRAGRRSPVRGGEGRCGATNSPCEAPIAGAGPRMLGIAAPIGRARSRAISIAARVGPARPRSSVRGREIRASHLRGAVRGPDRPCELSLLARPRLRAGAVDHEGYAGLSAHPARRAAAEITTRARAHPPDLAAHQPRWRAPLRAGQTSRAPASRHRSCGPKFAPISTRAVILLPRFARAT